MVQHTLPHLPPYLFPHTWCCISLPHTLVPTRLVLHLYFHTRVLTVFPQHPPPPTEDPETALAVDIVKCVRDKMPAPDLHAWLNEHGVPRVGSPTGVLRGLVRALLTAGSKSFTHMVVVVERYHAVLVAAAQEAGDEVCMWGMKCACV